MIYLKKHRASISVMVLIMTVIIITIGLSYVFLNKTNNDLASKNKEWLLDYYTIESALNEDIANIEDYLNNNLKPSPSTNKLDEIEKALQAKLQSDMEIMLEDDSLVVELFIDNQVLNLESNIGIASDIMYNIKTRNLFIKKLKEIPPELEYHSFY